MAQITLQIVGNVTDVQQKIAIIKSDLLSIGQQPINISVAASGLDAIVSRLKEASAAEIAASEAAAKLADAQARKINAETRAAESAAKLGTAQRQQAQAANEAAQAQNNIAASMELSVRNTGAMLTQIQRLTAAYLELRGAASGGATGNPYSGNTYGGFSGYLPVGSMSETGGTGWTWDDGYITDVPYTISDIGKSAETAAGSLRDMGKAQDEVSASAGRAATQSAKLWANIKKFASWYLIGGAISAVVRTLSDAVTTMKEVDTQLTNIQKVSGATAEEIKRIGNAAYDTASKYGVAAEEYLSAVYTFQKAGLGDSAEKMGELATKTMLVGDTTADVASKFLIAVNAAWDLKGSYEALSRVVDEADYINNNYATDLEKLSAGMPIVASTAANMNMSIEETLAVLGTITAKTQETGTKAATAWRALVMNITKEIGSVTDETGETIEVTEESVKAISDALKIYGNEAVQTAQKTGELIDPMEAVSSLAEAYKDGLLNDIELENILMNVGGKLRTNQLTALVKDLASETSTYYDIMSKLPEAAGTADAEIDLMLGSWESKTQILKNTWTEFISHLVEIDAVKGTLDVLTTLVGALDTKLGRGVITVLAFAAAVTALIKAGTAAKTLLGAGGLVGAIESFVGAIMAGQGALAGLSAAWAASPFGMAVIAVAAIYGIVKAVDALVVTQKEYAEALRDAITKYEEAISEVDSLNEALRQNIQLLQQANAEGDDSNYIVRLEAENTKLREQIELKLELARSAKAEAAQNAVAVLSNKMPTQGDRDIIEAATRRISDVVGGTYISDELQEWVNEIIEAVDAIDALEASGGELSSEMVTLRDRANQFLDAFRKAYSNPMTTQQVDEMLHQAEVMSKVYDALTAELQDVEGETAKTYEELKRDLDPLTKAYDEINSKQAMSESTMEALRSAYPDLGNQISVVNGQYLISSETLEQYINDVLRANGYVTEATAAQRQLNEALEEGAHIAGTSGRLFVQGDELENSAKATQGLAAAQEALNAAYAEGDEAYETLKTSLDPLMDAYGELNDKGVMTEKTAEALTKAFPDLRENVERTGEGFVISKEALDEYIESVIAGTIAAEEEAEAIRSAAEAVEQDALPAFKALSDAYYEVEDSGKVSFSTVSAIAKQFADVTGIEKYIDRLLKLEQSGEDVSQVLTDLAYALLENADYAKALAESDADLVAAMLEETGVANADEAALELIAAAKESVALQSALAEGNIDDFSAALANEAGWSDTARKALIELAAKMIAANSTNMSFSQQITALKQLAAAAGVAMGALASASKAAMIQQEIDAGHISGRFAESWLATAQQMDLDTYVNAITAAMDSATGLSYTPSSGGKSGGSGKSGSSGSGKSSSGSSTDTELERRKDAVALRKQELEFLEASGASEEKQIAKMRQIQEALHAQKTYMDAIGASEKDRLELSTEWWTWQNKINDLLADQSESERDRLKDVVSLRESELEFLEASGASEAERIAKNREIQDALHAQAEEERKSEAYLRGDADAIQSVLALSTKWWKIQNDILKLQEEIKKKQEEILDELRDGLTGYLDAAEKAAKGPLQEQLDALKDQAKEAKAAREEEEKRLAVQKARIALENAQRERTIRQYNAASGQWEWVADAAAVQSAKETLADAEKALAEFLANKAQDELEGRIDRIGKAYDELRSAIDTITDAIKSGAMTFGEAYDYIDQAMRGIYDKYGVDLTGHLTSIVADFDSINDQLIAMYAKMYETARAAGDAEGMAAAHSAANAVKTANGGEATNAAMDIASVSAKYSGKTIEDYAAEYAAAKARGDAEAMEAANRAANILRGLGNVVTATADIAAVRKSGAYDSGGILHGMGGIKATREDEMVIPPAMTKSLLDAERNGAFASLMEHLGIVTSAAQGYAGVGGGVTRNSVGSQHNGDVYYFNGMELKNITESTSMGEFLRQVKALSLYSGG